MATGITYILVTLIIVTAAVIIALKGFNINITVSHKQVPVEVTPEQQAAYDEFLNELEAETATQNTLAETIKEVQNLFGGGIDG